MNNQETVFRCVQIINKGKGNKFFYIQKFFKGTDICVKPKVIYKINSTGYDYYKSRGVVEPIDVNKFYFKREGK